MAAPSNGHHKDTTGGNSTAPATAAAAATQPPLRSANGTDSNQTVEIHSWLDSIPGGTAAPPEEQSATTDHTAEASTQDQKPERSWGNFTIHSGGNPWFQFTVFSHRHAPKRE